MNLICISLSFQATYHNYDIEEVAVNNVNIEKALDDDEDLIDEHNNSQEQEPASRSWGSWNIHLDVAIHGPSWVYVVLGNWASNYNYQGQNLHKGSKF